ncbi:Hypothetical predicted protein [Podarcis lilfordi]|uniref:Uncharacterized protein n=1 Tax=Podarcis lilfordi TaxID=74358 RepID=A0AA35JTJ2_9SAUR|nr:Hypothetical predicted protein [Podarcis lilfordi]
MEESTPLGATDTVLMSSPFDKLTDAWAQGGAAAAAAAAAAARGGGERKYFPCLRLKSFCDDQDITTGRGRRATTPSLGG